MRTLSLNMREAMTAEATGLVPIVLITVEHADLDAPLRFSSDPTTRLETDPQLIYGTVSRGDDYYFVPISLVLPGDDEESMMQARIVVDNIDRSMVELLRTIYSDATVLVEIVTSEDLDTVDIALPVLDLQQADYDFARIEIMIGSEALNVEPYPGGSFLPSGFPGLYL